VSRPRVSAQARYGAGFVDRFGRDATACHANAERAQEIGGEVGRLWNLLNADHVLLGREVAKKVTQLNRLKLVWRAMVTVSDRDLEWADALEELAAWDEARHTDSKPVGVGADRQALTGQRLAE
jgi:hypothetical protein